MLRIVSNILMNKLLLVITNLCLSTNKLARIVDLIVIMIVLLLLNTLWRLPTSRFSLVCTIFIHPLTFKPLRSLLLHLLIVIRIIKLCCISELRFLELIGWWINYDLFIWYYHLLRELLHLELLRR